MAQDYNEYLASSVLNEQQLVSYRSLSRALKVHSNLAKQMLYDFHHKQNAKKPGTVHATYLLTGIRRVNTTPDPTTTATNGIHNQDGEDTVMQSSPPILPSSSAANPDEPMADTHLIRSILIVREEQLEQAKRTFESISTIHIYSLQANGLGDIQALAECNRKIATSYASEDPLQAWKQYGTIQNRNVKRRTARTAPPPPAPLFKDAEAKTKPFATTAKAKEAQMKAEDKQVHSKSTLEPEKKGIMPKPAQAKRQNSDIFKSFAKASTKVKEDSKSSAESSPAPEIDNEPMTGFSDDDPLVEDDVLPEREPTVPSGKSKEERKAELQAMMDQEDEPMEDIATPEAEAEEADPSTGKHESAAEAEPTETMTVENGRRRGRRRVMKKKTAKDEEGYLVTKEEAVWESFSEDEPEPKRIKVPPATTMNTGSNKPSGGKRGVKAAQGNIMSFFSKK